MTSRPAMPDATRLLGSYCLQLRAQIKQSQLCWCPCDLPDRPKIKGVRRTPPDNHCGGTEGMLAPCPSGRQSPLETGTASMADGTNGSNGKSADAAAPAPAPQTQAQVQLVGQYIKDLS